MIFFMSYGIIWIEIYISCNITKIKHKENQIFSTFCDNCKSQQIRKKPNLNIPSYEGKKKLRRQSGCLKRQN